MRQIGVYFHPNTGGHIMIDMKTGDSTLRKPKELTVCDMIQQNEAAGPKPGPGDLRAYLVQRTMAKHRFTEEQALAVILAFGG
jgi:hypothetical protein